MGDDDSNTNRITRINVGKVSFVMFRLVRVQKNIMFQLKIPVLVATNMADVGLSFFVWKLSKRLLKENRLCLV